MRRALAILIVALLSGCYPELDWREFVSDEGHFAVLLPGKPTHAARAVTLGGMATQMDMLSVNLPGLAFGIGYADLPPGADPARAVAAGRDALARNINGRITAERTLELQGAQGVEFEAMGVAQEAPMRLAARVLVGGARFYQVVFVGREDRAGAADPALFLGSFKLLPPFQNP